MAEQEGGEQYEELLDYTENEQAADQVDAGAGEAAANGDAVDGMDAEAAPEGDQAAEDPTPSASGRLNVDRPDPLSQPPHGTEVYMANMAMDASDDQIRAFCEKMGEVFQLRIPKNPDGRNRGYGFVVYTTKTAAENAVQHLNMQELPDFPGRKVRVNESQVKNRLFMGNLPRSMTLHQLEEELKKEVVGLEDVELMMDKENPELNRGFGFATFYNYACADQARRKYTDTERTLGGRPVTITWAEPKKEEDTSKVGRGGGDVEGVKAVYVGGLPETVTEDKLRDLFKAYGEVEKVMLPYSKDDPSKYRDYGFVHFKERSSALQAIARVEEDKPSVDGKEIAEEGYGEEEGYGDEGYGAAASYGGYAAAAAAPVSHAAGATALMPVQLPNGQVGYMMVPAGAAAAGAGGPMRRTVAAAGYGAAGYGAAATGYGARSAGAGYAAAGRTGTGYGRGSSNGSSYRPY
eukprot:gene4666-4919_t